MLSKISKSSKEFFHVPVKGAFQIRPALVAQQKQYTLF